MGYSITIEIPTEATDLNRILGVNRFKKHSLFKKIKSDMAALIGSKRPEEPLTKFSVMVTRYGAKPLDYDNLVASLKPFIDSLTLSKVIKDDSWAYIQHIPVFQVSSKIKKLVIRVEEL